MTVYAIGDVQGCYERMRRVLDMVRFDPSQDQLWVAGDLVNRGPQSLLSLRYVYELGDAARMVLGNHDLHLLAVAAGSRKSKGKDTLDDILKAPDCDVLLEWLRHQPLALHDAQRDLIMTHAGIPPGWTIEQTLGYAAEVEAVLRSKRVNDFFDEMYGNEPAVWSPDLSGMKRLRVITNFLTRMRFVNDAGAMDFTAKESLSSAPKGFRPWFAYPRADATRILFGHWAALKGETGSDRFLGLDTGCVWGGELTLLNVDTFERTSCACD